MSTKIIIVTIMVNSSKIAKGGKVSIPASSCNKAINVEELIL
ncbi:MAG: hypothetical protein O7C58_01300 [Rickettsia endosymbiont of Ixodes persulcatus]|nr:hypothetical protein [Rickettsia endosymbiont of Ixodes persulcatus]MCZ6902853.1 hypothetical protein [Rickettsia endosymbiont of Ixodes persulcatus]MCZ6909397.1 hypothetical protein [Rickettsia endosymbiont of Ixodes persulcatus]MCZ6909796.1 hypothetical protein [Rickettsia endosymbiont of Ixodes persulcatus]MCZ6919066.1 hypothetical protein [Rickettsia endosymbiont of Ixodes persulcatus]